MWGDFSIGGSITLFFNIRSFCQNMDREIVYNYIVPFMYDVLGGPASFVVQEDNCVPRPALSIATSLATEEVT